MFSHPDYDGHQELRFAHDADSGLRALIAIHDTTLGPAFGGCRMYPYASEHHAMADVLRLSRGMTYKAAICELPYGGGKSVIIATSAGLSSSVTVMSGSSLALSFCIFASEVLGRYLAPIAERSPRHEHLGPLRVAAAVNRWTEKWKAEHPASS